MPPPSSFIALANPGAGSLSGMLMLGGVVLLGLLGASWLKKHATRRAPGAREPAPRPARASGRASLEHLMADAEELARQLDAHLDAKAARLETLIAEADDRLARLEGADRAGARRHTPAQPVAMIESRRAASPAPFGAPEIDPLSRQVYLCADEGLAPVEIARRLDEQIGKVELILALREP